MRGVRVLRRFKMWLAFVQVVAGCALGWVVAASGVSLWYGLGIFALVLVVVLSSVELGDLEHWGGESEAEPGSVGSRGLIAVAERGEEAC